MKIVHINLIDQFNDDWSYQDNLLPRMHKRMGHDVTMITTCRKFGHDGSLIDVEPQSYTLPDGVKIIRLENQKKFFIKKLQNILDPYPLYEVLYQIKPDLIMVHGLTARYNNAYILKYIKKVNPSCILVTDSHNCEINANDHLAKTFKEKLIVRFTNAMRKSLYPYCKRIFGITPACVNYAINQFKAPPDKTALLPLGYDPRIIEWERRQELRAEFRQKYGFNQDDILVIHGGKIIQRRKTPETIEAVMKLEDPRVKLVIFGGMDEEMKPQVEPLIQKNSDRVLYLGSLTPEQYHVAYCASDLALFPGGQSVLWQQAIGCGLPIIVGNDKNLDYLNRGGNAAYINDTSVDGIHAVLLNVLQGDNLKSMKAVAETEARDFFSYERIAKLVTDCVD